MAKKTVKKSQPKKSATKKTDREIVYAKPSVKLYGGEKPPLTVAIAKKLLGWREESEKEKFGNDFLLKDRRGLKIRCENNEKNRPISMTQLLSLIQEILNGQWQLTNEALGIGVTGQVVDGQHRLIALILAVQEWEDDREKWIDTWKEEPTIPIPIIFGIDESDIVVNVINTGKPRSFSDAMYRSDYFQDLPHKERKVAAKITEYAVGRVWYRTGESLDAFAPRRTHSESFAFLKLHPKLLRCIKHIQEENSSGKISNLISPGYAAGLLYLMSCCDTDPSEYKETRSEKSLDFSQYEKACDFWTLVAGNSPEVSAIRKALSRMKEEECSSIDSRLGVFCKAWNLYVEDKPITEAAIKLKYTEDEDGLKTLDELPIVDGIDIGDPNKIDESHVDAKDPTREEIEDRKTKERENRKTTKKKKTTTKKPTKKTTKKKSPRKLQVGSVRWVCEEGTEPYKGRVVELNLTVAKMLVSHGFQGAGNTVLAQIADLRTSQPKPQEA